jgi:hypothetical protein
VGNRGISGNTAINVDSKETAIDLTVDNFLNLSLNTFSAGTNVALISLSVRHFL